MGVIALCVRKGACGACCEDDVPVPYVFSPLLSTVVYFVSAFCTAVMHRSTSPMLGNARAMWRGMSRGGRRLGIVGIRCMRRSLGSGCATNIVICL